MKSIKAWAVIERKTGEIFRDSEDGGETWNLYIRLTRKECGELMDEYCAVPIEIREQSEIERLERENAQLKQSQAKQFDDSYKLTVEKQRLERQLEAAETALKSIEDDMRYKPVQFDWPVWATKWLASIVDYFAQSQKGSTNG